jgi:hypothetical protein
VLVLVILGIAGVHLWGPFSAPSEAPAPDQPSRVGWAREIGDTQVALHRVTMTMRESVEKSGSTRSEAVSKDLDELGRLVSRRTSPSRARSPAV